MPLDEEWEQSGLVGRTVAGRYLIANELATDARRKLYEAEHVERGVRVTLAVVGADSTAEQRLENAKKLQALDEPGLAHVIDVGRLDSGELYIATERPDGTTLRTLAGEGKRFDPRRSLLIIRKVLDALTAAHAAGAVHGDVKPESIVITPGLGDDRIKLTDFGIATLSGGKQAGDPLYSAPETALGNLDARADIYSTGAVLSELLTGHPAFFAEDQNELRRLHAYAPRKTLNQRTPDLVCVDLLEAIVAKALEKKPEDRYQSAKEMIADLDPALDAIEAATTPAATERSGKLDESLLLLARDLVPPPASVAPPVVPVNVTRQVRELPWHMRAQNAARRGYERVDLLVGKLIDKVGLRPKLDALTQRQRRAIGGGAAALAVILLITAFVTCGGGSKSKPAAGDKPIATTTAANTYVKRATAALAAGDEDGALTAYKEAFRLSPALASDANVLDGLNRIASSPKAATRHRALEIAEGGGVGEEIDRVASWILDLEQATTCDERRAAIDKLAELPDPRSLPALKKARAQKCVEKDANTAIQRISTAKALHHHGR